MHPFFTAHALLAAFLLFPPNYAASAVSEPGWRPDRMTIDRIEAALLMPVGAEPLSAYRRRYGGVVEEGRRMIWGVFHLPVFASDDPPIDIIDYRPISLVEDAGCSVVTVKYDAEADRVLWVICNGEA
jgi:hypothetical protein